ncbi:MAG: hypothetical protein KDB84_00175 [Flavobacteriales bacterium]|nr:hypothetical protein [Flavobacteriales bacterium]
MNERIDHTNYEAWLLDRAEGNLSPEQELALATFLLLHPELAPMEGPLPGLSDLASRLSSADRNALKRTLPPQGPVDARSVDDHLVARGEGDLDAAQEKALDAWLSEHPEDHRAARAYALARIPAENITYTDKRSLERTIPPTGMPTRASLDDHLVARLEGDLDREQISALDAMLASDPGAARAWTLMQLARIEAVPMHFAGKDRLKRSARIIPIGWASAGPMRLAIAASVAVLLGVGIMLLNDEPTVSPQLADAVVPGADTEASSGTEQATGPVIPAVNDPSADQADPRSQGQGSSRQGSTPEVQRAVVTPIEREDPLPLAQRRGPEWEAPGPRPVPRDVQVATVPEPEELLAEAPRAIADPVNTTVGGLVASAFRGRVLDEPTKDLRPLDGGDAIAALDKGLKAVAGERAGLSVDRRNGRVHRFDLRLGRNLAITAGR